MTTRARIERGAAIRNGWRPLVQMPGDPHQLLAGPPLPDDWRAHVKPLVVIAQLSDLHVMDAQSPARFELLDRSADPDSPWLERLSEVGSYRPQELFTHHVVEAMVQAVNDLEVGPISGAPVDLAVVTGDMTDNAQRNELDNYLALLNGHELVTPDSGDLSRWEGVGAHLESDDRFWHPDDQVNCRPRARYGYPTIPGLLDVARRPFRATGLLAPWLAAHGNHDQLIQGTVPPTGPWNRLSLTDRKAVSPASGFDAVRAFTEFEQCNPGALGALSACHAMPVTADKGRRHVTKAEHISAHLACSGRPSGHGYTAGNVEAGTAYYVYDISTEQTPVRCVVLDTVNEHGGWQGSIDEEQLAWLRQVLDDSHDRVVLVFSHHTLETMINDRAPATAPRRVLGAELRDALLARPEVSAWINGHTHRHNVASIRRSDGTHGFWQITTASHIDWPQQARIIELMETDRQLVIACTVIDSAGRLDWQGGDDPISLAGLSRELAANAWQSFRCLGSGTPLDRNVVAAAPHPARLRVAG